MTKERDIPVEPTKRDGAEALPDGRSRRDLPQSMQTPQEQVRDDREARVEEDKRQNVLQADLPKVKLIDASKSEDLVPVDGLNGETVAVKALVAEVPSHSQREPWSADAVVGIVSDSALAISMGAAEKISKDVRAIFDFIGQVPESIQNALSQASDAPVDPRNPINLITTLPKCRERLEAYAREPSDENRKELTRSVSQAFKWGDVGEAMLNTMCNPNEAKHLNDAVVRTVQPHIEALSRFCVESAKASGKMMDEKPMIFAGINIALDGACLKYALKPSEENAAALSKELAKGFLAHASKNDREVAEEYFKTVLAPNKELQIKHAETLLQKAGYMETKNALADYEKDPSELNRFRLIQSLGPNAGSAAGDLIENVIVMVAPESAGVLGSRLLGTAARGGAEAVAAVSAEVKASQAISTDAVAGAETQTIKLKPDEGQKLEIPQPQYQEAKTSARKSNQSNWAEADPSTKDDIRLTSKFREPGKEEKLLKALDRSKNKEGQYTFAKSVEPLAELSDFYTKHGFYRKAEQVQLTVKELQDEALAAGKVEGAKLLPEKPETGLRALINKGLEKWERREAESRIANADRSVNLATHSYTRTWSDVVKEHDQEVLNDMIGSWRKASVDCRKLGQLEKADRLETHADDLAIELEKQIIEGRKMIAPQERIIGELKSDANKWYYEALNLDLDKNYSKIVRLNEKAINNLETAILKGDNNGQTVHDLCNAYQRLSDAKLSRKKNFDAYEALLKCRSFVTERHLDAPMSWLEKNLVGIIEKTPELQRGATAQEFELYENHVKKCIAEADERIRNYYGGTPELWPGQPSGYYRRIVLPQEEKERLTYINRSIKTLQSNNPKLLQQIFDHLGYRLDGEKLIKIDT